MKKYFITAAVLLAVTTYAQQIPLNLKAAVYRNLESDSILKPKIVPDLAYYSKNYNAVFGQYQYTLNGTAFSNARNIYVLPDDKFLSLSDRQFVNGMPFPGDTVWPESYGKVAFVSGVLSMLLGENLINIENALSWKTGK